jgi:hypothetical protein
MSDLLNTGLMHLAALIGVAALMFRDQLVLRALLIASTVLYISYYLFIPDAPAWSAIFWNLVTLGVNALTMARLVFDRTQFRLSDDELRLFASFRSLTPGEFRLLTSLATWKSATTQTILTREGARLDRLYYVLDGAIGIAKGGRSFPIGAGTFIGEIAFLRGQPASATVTLETGARYIEWSSDALTTLLARNPTLEGSLRTLFNADMAAKVARA